VINDVKVDPYLMVLHMMLMFFNGQKRVHFDQLRQFFSEFDSYFEPGDIEGFLGEVAYLKRGSEEVALQELASMVRDDVEHFAK